MKINNFNDVKVMLARNRVYDIVGKTIRNVAIPNIDFAYPYVFFLFDDDTFAVMQNSINNNGYDDIVVTEMDKDITAIKLALLLRESGAISNVLYSIITLERQWEIVTENLNRKAKTLEDLRLTLLNANVDDLSACVDPKDYLKVFKDSILIAESSLLSEIDRSKEDKRETERLIEKLRKELQIEEQEQENQS